MCVYIFIYRNTCRDVFPVNAKSQTPVSLFRNDRGGMCVRTPRDLVQILQNRIRELVNALYAIYAFESFCTNKTTNIITAVLEILGSVDR